MKKSRFLMIGLIAVLFLTACFGGNAANLTCTNEETEEGMEINQSVTFRFEGDNPYFVDMKMEFVIVDEEMQALFGILAAAMEAEFEAFDNKDGMEVEVVTNEDNHAITVNFKMDLREVSASDLRALAIPPEILDREGTRDSIKEEAEEEGFSCN